MQYQHLPAKSVVPRSLGANQEEAIFMRARTHCMIAVMAMLMGANAGAATLRGLVVDVSRPSVYSGVIASWVELSIRERSGARVTKAFILNLDEMQVLPAIGETCKFSYEVKSIDGMIGQKIRNAANAKVIDEFACDPRQPAGRASAKMLANNIYAQVVARHPVEIPQGEDMKAFAPLLSKSLIRRMEQAAACGEDWYRQNPDPRLKPEFGWLELGLFSGGTERTAPDVEELLSAEG